MTGNGKKMVKDTQNQTMTFDSTGIILYNVYNENDEFSNSSMFVTIIYDFLLSLFFLLFLNNIFQHFQNVALLLRLFV